MPNLCRQLAILLAVWGIAPGSPLSAQPINDSCLAATSVSLGIVSGSTLEATSDGFSICDERPGDEPDIWYRYTASQSGLLVADTCLAGTTNYDTAIALYSGCSGNGSQALVCNDEYRSCPQGESRSRAAVPVQANETVMIRVFGFGGDAGDFDLRLSLESALPNDACEDAIPISPGETYTQDLSLATPDGASLCSFEPTQDVWYTYTPSEDGQVSLDTCHPGSDELFDTAISVYSACPGNLTTELSCESDGGDCAINSLLAGHSFDAVAGTTYYIRLGSFTQSWMGTYELTVDGPPTVAPTIFADGFELGNTSTWSSGSAPSAE